jgi:acetyl-CoA acetyltransferase
LPRVWLCSGLLSISSGLIISYSDECYSGLALDYPGTVVHSTAGCNHEFCADDRSPHPAGPCLATHTACSSSLVATHLAAAGLRAGEAGAAVAAGVFLMLLGGTMAGICQLQARTAHAVV